MAKIFISYKRNIEPDTPVATAVYEELQKEHDVFIDNTILVGEKWAQRIQREIKDSDYLITFLSEQSVNSEMMIAEIEEAHHHSRTYGKPIILPVRVDFEDVLAYPLSAYLNPLQTVSWVKDDGISKLIEELKLAIDGGELHTITSIMDESEKKYPPAVFANITSSLESPEGTMPNKSPFYIERESDREAMEAICNTSSGVTITIKGPRQVGKSSLLNRVMQRAYERGMKTAFIDFQMIEIASMQDSEVFYRQFCNTLAWEFELEDRTEEVWRIPLGAVQKTTNYVQRHILNTIPDAPVLLAMDEVERMFASPFRSDFFSMLRSWHNRRAQGGVWERFNLALVTSTEPYQFISDLNQSPFNVGQVIALKGFTASQVEELNKRYGNPLLDSEIDQLFNLLNGHPYLTRKALHLIASGRVNFNILMRTAIDDDGPFGDHLLNHLFRLQQDDRLVIGYKDVINKNVLQDEKIYFRLRGAGLAAKEAYKVVPSNKLYLEYFRRRLIDA